MSHGQELAGLSIELAASGSQISQSQFLSKADHTVILIALGKSLNGFATHCVDSATSGVSVELELVRATDSGPNATAPDSGRGAVKL